MLTNKQLALIRYIVDHNDITIPNSLVSDVLQEDKSEKHRVLVDGFLKRVELKENLKYQFNNNFLYVEDVSNFHEKRYFLTVREKDLFQHVVKMRDVAEQMENMGIHYMNTSLLYGESGTGKTMFGRYLAYKLGLPFVYINLSFVISSRLGGTSQNLFSVFNNIKKTPCVFMLDELDCIGQNREGSDASDKERNNIVISLMQLLDNLSSRVIVLVATNRKDIIDNALLRRFSVKHEVVKLQKEERIALCENFLSSLPLEIPSSVRDEILREAELDSTQARLILMMTNYIADILMGMPKEVI